MNFLRQQLYQLIEQKREIYKKFMNNEITSEIYLEELKRIEREFDKLNREIKYLKVNDKILEEILI